MTQPKIFSNVCLFLLVLGAPVVFAGEDWPPDKFTKLTARDGLPHDGVMDVLQDRFGFIWFATLNGLVQYDGRVCTTFKPEPGRVGGLTERQILRIVEGDGGDLWLGTVKGLEWFHRESRQFSRVVLDPEQPNQPVLAIWRETEHRWWVGTLKGLYEIHQNESHEPKVTKKLDGYAVWAVARDPAGLLWVGTGRGLLRENQAGAEADPFEIIPLDPAHPTAPIKFLGTDPLGRLWVGSGSMRDPSAGLGLFMHQPDGNWRKFSHDQQLLAHNNVLTVAWGRNGRLWIGSGGTDSIGGLSLLDPATQTARHYRHDPQNPSCLSSNLVFGLHEGRDGILWATTMVGGVNRLDPRGGAFTKYHTENENPDRRLARNRVWSLFSDEAGSIWLGGRNTLQQITAAPAGGLLPEESVEGTVTAIQADGHGGIWLGTLAGLFHRDTNGRLRSFSPLSADRPRTDRHKITALAPDTGGLWVGSFAGLGFLPTGADQIQNIVLEQVTAIRQLVLDETGRLWIVTRDNQLVSRDVRGTQQTWVDPARGLSDITTVYAEHPDRLWVGTAYWGLLCLNPETRHIQRSSEQQGLLHDEIMAIQQDAAGFIWLATGRGLARFDPSKGRFANFAMNHGFRQKLGLTASAVAADGRLFFGGADGLVSFDPGVFARQDPPPRVVFTQFQLFDAALPIDPHGPVTRAPELMEHLALNDDQNDVAFAFTAPRFDESLLTYEVRLAPYDQTWRALPAGGRAAYTNLAPDHYQLRVRARDRLGRRGAERLLTVTIRPPWWQTPAAWSAFGILFLLLLFGFHRGGVAMLARRNQLLERLVGERTNQAVAEKERAEAAVAVIEKQAEQLEEMNRIKSRFFAHISHEFRTPLSLILGPLQDVRNGVYGHLDETLARHLGYMRRSALRLSRLIDQLLDLSRLEAGRMELRATPLDLVTLVRGLTQTFASMAERRHIQLRFDCELESVWGEFDRDKLEKAVTNLIANAFKFTEDHGKIRIALTAIQGLDQPTCDIVVQDTGKGIEASQLAGIFEWYRQGSEGHTARGSGIGLALTHELVNLHGGRLTVESQVGFGSTFSIRLPIHNTDAAVVAPLPAMGEEEVAALLQTAEPEPPLETEADREDVPPVPVKGELGEKPTCLVVEDQPEVRLYIADHLAPGFRIRLAANGRQGLALAREIKPDLVVSDVMMPEWDGYDLCKAIKSDEALFAIPVILLTARADESGKLEGLALGADDYIFKPFNGQELLARAENLVVLRRRLSARFSGEIVIKPSEVQVASVDEQFLERLQSLVEAQMGDAGFGVEQLAREIGLSRRQLLRKVRELTRLTPIGYIRLMRLERALQLLRAEAGNVSEIAAQVGFTDPAYFSTVFRRAFGVTPIQVLRDDAAVDSEKPRHS